MSVLFFCIFEFVLYSINGVVQLIVMMFSVSGNANPFEFLYSSSQFMANFGGGTLILLCIELLIGIVVGAVCYLLAHRLIETRLNLE
jgi:uncharacterized membrane protein